MVLILVELVFSSLETINCIFNYSRYTFVRLRFYSIKLYKN